MWTVEDLEAGDVFRFTPIGVIWLRTNKPLGGAMAVFVSLIDGHAHSGPYRHTDDNVELLDAELIVGTR